MVDGKNASKLPDTSATGNEYLGQTRIIARADKDGAYHFYWKISGTALSGRDLKIVVSNGFDKDKAIEEARGNVVDSTVVDVLRSDALDRPRVAIVEPTATTSNPVAVGGGVHAMSSESTDTSQQEPTNGNSNQLSRRQKIGKFVGMAALTGGVGLAMGLGGAPVALAITGTAALVKGGRVAVDEFKARKEEKEYDKKGVALNIVVAAGKSALVAGTIAGTSMIPVVGGVLAPTVAGGIGAWRGRAIAKSENLTGWGKAKKILTGAGVGAGAYMAGHYVLAPGIKDVLDSMGWTGGGQSEVSPEPTSEPVDTDLGGIAMEPIDINLAGTAIDYDTSAGSVSISTVDGQTFSFDGIQADDNGVLTQASIDELGSAGVTYTPPIESTSAHWDFSQIDPTYREGIGGYELLETKFGMSSSDAQSVWSSLQDDSDMLRQLEATKDFYVDSNGLGVNGGDYTLTPEAEQLIADRATELGIQGSGVGWIPETLAVEAQFEVTSPDALEAWIAENNPDVEADPELAPPTPQPENVQSSWADKLPFGAALSVGIVGTIVAFRNRGKIQRASRERLRKAGKPAQLGLTAVKDFFEDIWKSSNRGRQTSETTEMDSDSGGGNTPLVAVDSGSPASQEISSGNAEPESGGGERTSNGSLKREASRKRAEYVKALKDHGVDSEESKSKGREWEDALRKYLPRIHGGQKFSSETGITNKINEEMQRARTQAGIIE